MNMIDEKKQKILEKKINALSDIAKYLTETFVSDKLVPKTKEELKQIANTSITKVLKGDNIIQWILQTLDEIDQNSDDEDFIAMEEFSNNNYGDNWEDVEFSFEDKDSETESVYESDTC